MQVIIEKNERYGEGYQGRFTGGLMDGRAYDLRFLVDAIIAIIEENETVNKVVIDI